MVSFVKSVSGSSGKRFIRRFGCRGVEVASDEDAVILTCIAPDEVFEQASLLLSVGLRESL